MVNVHSLTKISDSLGKKYQNTYEDRSDMRRSYTLQ